LSFLLSRESRAKGHAMKSVWIFNGLGGKFPAAVFSSRKKANIWIEKHQVSGCLTKYPMNISVYDWIIAHKDWKPSKAGERTARFIQAFSHAGLEHYHYEFEKSCP
jgi:hypothetical protein